VGLFDEAIVGPSFEDEELWLRIAQKYPYGYLPEPTVIYRIHESNGSLNSRRNCEGEYRALMTTLARDPNLWRQLEGPRARQKLARLAYECAYACLHDGDESLARTYLRDAWRHGGQRMRLAAYWSYSWLPRRVRTWIRSARGRVRNTPAERLPSAAAPDMRVTYFDAATGRELSSN
jgi:hypothetical protein